MSKYSFLLASEETSYFEITPTLRMQKHGGWLVAESIEQEEISKTQSQSTIKAVQLAKKIAAAKDIPLDEAFELLQGGGGFSETELLADYTEEALSMVAAGGSAEMGNARLITAFMRCRGEGLVGDEWTRLEDWSMEDTKSMTRELITKALEFIADEQDAEVKAAQAKKSKRKAKEDALPNE
jgi:hypothetical protein